MIHAQWERIAIKELYLGLFDGPHATPKPSNEGPVFLGIGNIPEDGHLDLGEIRHISEEDFPKWTKRVMPMAGDIVFTYEATLNRYAIIPKGFRGCLGRRLALIRPNPEVVDTRFLYYYFFGGEWKRTIASNIILGATVERIPLIKFPNFPVMVPPIHIQKKIAAILSTYDDLIENNTRRIKILEEMAQTIYREWFVNFRFPEHENVKMVDSPLGKIPEGWTAKRLDHFGSIILGKTPSKKVNEFFGSDMLFIKLPDMHGNMFCYVTSESLSIIGVKSQANKTLPPGSLCVSCIGTGGVVCITAKLSQTNQQINSLIPNSEKHLEFLFFSLLGLREKINQYGSTGATMINLNKEKFSALEVLCPHLTQLEIYHDLVAPKFKLISSLELKNLILKKTRDLLLSKLISGELDISELDIKINGTGNGWEDRSGT